MLQKPLLNQLINMYVCHLVYKHVCELIIIQGLNSSIAHPIPEYIIYKMELCPSPDQTTVEPDERGKKLRTMLHGLYYGEMVVVALRFWALGPAAGFFQLINLWICYTAYATINFCSCFIYFMICFMEFMFIFVDYRRALIRFSTDKSGNVSQTDAESIAPWLFMAFSYIFIYNTLAMFYSYRSYSHFKWLFQVQHAGAYQDMDGNGDYYDDEEARYQEQQRRMREQFVRQQQERQMQMQQQQRNNNSVFNNQPDYRVANPDVPPPPRVNIPTPQYPPPAQNGVVVHDFRRAQQVEIPPQPQPQPMLNGPSFNTPNASPPPIQQQPRASNGRGYVPFSGKGYSLQ